MNTFGSHFTFTSFGESHGAAVGGVLDGVPAGVSIDLAAIRAALDERAGRRAGELQGAVSPRAAGEEDVVEWLSGVQDGVSLGTPIAFIIRNTHARSTDYDWLLTSYRPGHADRVYEQKYGIRDARGGGRSSARETASRVVAGEVAKSQLLAQGITIHAELVQVGKEKNPELFPLLINQVRASGDSIGGIVRCTVRGVPAGWGEPLFDKLSSQLAAAMMSINACKGVDFGSGFEQVACRGSELYLHADGSAKQNCNGGIVGGISDGNEILFRCVFKPTPSNRLTLQAIAPEGVIPQGRFDACVAVRAVPVVEAMTALVLVNYL